jgi:hypothetical protein
MSNISVTTTQSVIAVTQTGGITVTTPEGQTIAVTVPNSSVNVTNTTDDITITEVGVTNTDQLIEGTTNLFFTNARARAAISLNSDDTSILDYNSTTGVFTWDTPTTTKINEGTNLYYTTARANTDFDTRLATKTTTNLAEGANLYYTTARANSDFDTRLATKDTDDLAEGSTNQYFTQARARASLSAGTGISYDSNTGVITNTSINTDTTYTQNASATTGGANLNLVGSDSTTDSVKFASGTNITVSRTDANTITIDGTDLNTTYTIASASTTGGANLTLTGSDSSTDSVAYKGAGATTVTSTDANTITITSTDTNTTYTQNASAATGGANLNLTGSDSSTDTIKFANGTNVTVTRTDADTITIASTDTNTTYTVDATATTGGANLNLTGSDSSTDSVAYLGSGATTVTRTDANTITISSTDNNTTYTQNASSVSGGANLNLVGSDSTTDSVAYLGSGATTVTRTDDSTITISSTDNNTTYTQNFSSTTGGTNLNLVGSDSTTDTVKFANGTGVTVSYTDADTATIAIGQSVGTGDNPTFAGATLGNVTVGVDTDQTISTSSGNLILQTATGTNAGSLTLTAGTNGDITLAPNGTGNVAFTFNNGGNLTNTRNYVAGAIRNATTDSIGDIWAVNSTGPIQPFRGVSVDNSADTTKNSGYVARNYSNTAGNRSRFIFERARGTAASPSAVQNGDFLGELDVTGYTSTGWLNDNVATVVPGFFGFTALENWVSNTNLGTAFALQLAPTATTITGPGNLVPTIISNPQALILRGDSFSISRGKATAFTATGSSVNGTTLTIGTVTSGTVAIGQVVQSSTTSLIGATYIVANISGSGSGSTWTLSSSQTTQSGLTITGTTGFIGSPSAATTVDALADLRLLTNNIKGSGGTTQITTSASGATLALNGDSTTINLANGTNIATFDNNRILNNRPHRSAVTTASIARGSTYTPASTVNNFIELTLTAGTDPTYIDVDNLTVAGEGGHQAILVYNNSGTSVGNGDLVIRNNGTTINNFQDSITDGGRVIFTIYCIGNYASCEYMTAA